MSRAMGGSIWSRAGTNESQVGPVPYVILSRARVLALRSGTGATPISPRGPIAQGTSLSKSKMLVHKRWAAKLRLGGGASPTALLAIPC